MYIIHHFGVETAPNVEWFSNTKQALLRPHSVGMVQSDQHWMVMDVLRTYMYTLDSDLRVLYMQVSVTELTQSVV